MSFWNSRLNVALSGAVAAIVFAMGTAQNGYSAEYFGDDAGALFRGFSAIKNAIGSTSDVMTLQGHAWNIVVNGPFSNTQVPSLTMLPETAFVTRQARDASGRYIPNTFTVVLNNAADIRSDEDDALTNHIKAVLGVRLEVYDGWGGLGQSACIVETRFLKNDTPGGAIEYLPLQALNEANRLTYDQPIFNPPGAAQLVRYVDDVVQVKRLVNADVSVSMTIWVQVKKNGRFIPTPFITNLPALCSDGGLVRVPGNVPPVINDPGQGPGLDTRTQADRCYMRGEAPDPLDETMDFEFVLSSDGGYPSLREDCSAAKRQWNEISRDFKDQGSGNLWCANKVQALIDQGRLRGHINGKRLPRHIEIEEGSIYQTHDFGSCRGSTKSRPNYYEGRGKGGNGDWSEGTYSGAHYQGMVTCHYTILSCEKGTKRPSIPPVFVPPPLPNDGGSYVPSQGEHGRDITRVHIRILESEE